MKTKSCYPLLIAFLIVLPALTRAGNQDAYTKKIKKSFSVSAGVQFNLSNKFGDVSCSLWEKDEISIEVTITAETRSADVAENIFAGIDVTSSQTGSTVDIRTSISENFMVKNSFSIDYQVHMPPYTQLCLTNRFGNVVLTELNSRSKLVVEHGKLEAANLNHGDNQVEISFGSASLGSVKGTMLNIKHSSLEADYIGNIRLTSDYSDISIGKAVMVDGTLTGGSLDMKTNSVLKLKSRFANIHIDLLDQKLEINGQYGNVEIDQVSPGFQVIDIINQFGNFEVRIPAEASYNLDASTEFGNIEFNSEKAVFTLRQISDNNQIYQGRIGENPAASVKVRSKFGRISLR
jgi:hypothetical protein